MSKVVDERVVEMRFDNKDFENNVKTSMSTLDKLKNALKLPDLQSKGNLSSLNNNIKTATQNMNGLNSAVNTVKASFGALDVMGVTALANITNSVLNSAKSMANSFTLAPITSGFREYETQMNAVQTIMANTASKGTTMSEVTAALDELNEYADQTIYNFTEMTKNIGTFTAAGVDLDKSVAAIKGIANLGAMSGSTSTQVSTAMYQLSQALASGRVALQDWNSIVNAGMGGEQFQNALKRTAEHFGTDVDAMIEKYGSFRDSLTQGGWLTAEVLTETLNQISGAYSEAELVQQGYSEAQAKEIVKMAETATDAATKVKTFTQLIDTLQEAAGSGWAKTFQIILGDFEEAKEFFTGLSEYLGDIIGGMGDARNNVLAGAFDSNFKKLTDAVQEAGVPLDTFNKKLKEIAKETYNIDLDELTTEFGSLDLAMQHIPQAGDMVRATIKALAGSTTEMNQSTEAMTDKLEYFQKVVDEVWKGNWKNAPERYQLLAEAGYDYAQVQDLVNKTVDGHRLTLDDLSESQMKAIGYTDKEVTKLKELAKQAEQSGTSINELIENINKQSGRQLFLDSIFNSIKAIAEPLKAVGQAFGQVFAIDPSNMYKAIEALHDFTSALVIDEDTYNNIVRISRGIFGIFNIFTTFGTGAFGIAFKALTAVLDNFNLGILDVLAFLGDLLYMFSDFVTSGEPIVAFFERIQSAIADSTGPIATFIDKFKEIASASEPIKTVIGMIEKLWNVLLMFSRTSAAEGPAKAFELLTSYLSTISWDGILSNLSQIGPAIVDAFDAAVAAAEKVGPDIIAGLQNGLSSGVDKVLGIMREIGSRIIDAICAVLGIHSPSTVMYDIGQNIVQGLINGIESLIDGVFSIITYIGDHIAELMGGEINWGAIAGVGLGAGLFVTLNNVLKVAQAIAAFSAPFEAAAGAIKNVSGAIGDIRDLIQGLQKVLKVRMIAESVKSFAVAIGILVGSIALLTLVDQSKLLPALGVVTAIVIEMGILAAALSALQGKTSALDVAKLAVTFVGVGTALLMIAGALTIIGMMPKNNVKQAVEIMTSFAAILSVLMLVSKFSGNVNTNAITKLMRSFATSMLLLAASLKIMGTLSDSEITKAAVILTTFAGLITVLTLISRLGKGMVGVGYTIKQFSTAMILLAVAAKIIGGMEWEGIGKAIVGLGGLTGIIALLVVISQIGSKGVMGSLGTTMLQLSGSLILMAAALKIIGGMEWEAIGKGLVGVGVLALFMAGLTKAITVAGGENKMLEVGSTLLAMSVAIGILAAVCVVLGYIDVQALAKGLTAVGILSLFVAGLTVAARGVNDIKGTMMGMAVAIGVLAASLAILSFIDTDKLLSSAIALGGVISAFAFALKSAGNMKDVKISSIITMIAALAAVSGSLYILAQMPVENTVGSATALSALLIALSASMKIMSGIGGVSGGALKSLVLMEAMLVPLVGILGMLQEMDIQASLPNVVAMSLLVNALAVACKILGTVGNVSATAMTTMLMLTGIVTVLASLIGLMSATNVQSAIPNAMALSTLLLAMSASCAILSAIPNISPTALTGITVMTGIVAALAVILGLLSALNIQASMANVVALSTLLLAMSASCAILSLGFAITPMALTAMMTLSGVIAILAVILGLMDTLDIEASMSNVLALSTLLLAMSAACVILSVVGMSGPAAIAGATTLIAVATELGIALAAFGAIKQIPGVDWLISEGATFMQKIGEAIGGFVGSIVGGFLTESTSSLGDVADNLSDFMERLQPFIEGAKSIDGSVQQSISNLSGAILALTAGDLLSSITSFITGGSSLSEFAEQLVPFGEAMQEYSAAVTGIDAEAVTASATAAKALGELANNLPKEGGLADAIFGADTGIDDFGSQLVSFGGYLKQYSEKVTGLDSESILASAKAGQALSELAGSLPKEGGLQAAIFGEGTDMETFGSQLVSFGGSLVSFSETCAGVQAGSIEAALPAAKALVEVAKSVAELKNGGWLDAITGGDMNLTSFGEQLSNFGNSIKLFATRITAEGVDLTAINTATTAVRNVVNFVKNIADDGENIDAGIANVEKLGDVGTAIKTYSSNIAEVNTANISSSVNAISSLMNLLTSMIGQDFASGVASFKAAIDELATVNIQGVIDAFANASGDMMAAGANLMSWLANGIHTGTDVVIAAAQAVLIALAAMIGEAIPAFETGGLAITQYLAKGIDSGEPLVLLSAQLILVRALSAITERYWDFYMAGIHLCQGLAAGITAGSYTVQARAAAMASSAASAARRALDINSPSKVFRKIGKSVPEGFAQGISMLGTSVSEAAKTMSNDAIDTTKRVIERMGNLIDGDIDINPVITPVVDLDNVADSVASINSLMSNTVPLTLSTNIGAINRMMNQRNQNGEYGEVVDAINQLDRSLQALERPTYNVGGITYDDGSAIAGAVGDLIRAARIEGRA